MDAEEGMSRLGKWGLIVPAKTAKLSSSINRVNALASASVANLFVSRGLALPWQDTAFALKRDVPSRCHCTYQPRLPAYHSALSKQY